jgi:hypothetical protein
MVRLAEYALGVCNARLSAYCCVQVSEAFI